MPSTIVYCTGEITEAATSSGQTVVGGVACPSGWVTAAYAPPFDVSQIDPVVLSGFFLAGFALFLTPYAAAWGMAQIVNAIRGK